MKNKKKDRGFIRTFYRYRSFMHLAWCTAALLALLALAQAQHGEGELTYDPNDPPPFREYQSFDGWFVHLKLLFPLP